MIDRLGRHRLMLLLLRHIRRNKLLHVIRIVWELLRVMVMSLIVRNQLLLKLQRMGVLMHQVLLHLLLSMMGSVLKWLMRLRNDWSVLRLKVSLSELISELMLMKHAMLLTELLLWPQV